MTAKPTSGATFSERLDRALIVAAIAHSEAQRKGTEIPYITHPVAVARLLERYGFHEDLVIAGLLHDVLEDFDERDDLVKQRFREVFPALQNAPTAFRAALSAFLNEQFGPNVMSLVEAVTERKRDENDAERAWLDRKKEQLEHFRQVTSEVAALKCADALHNAASILRDMRESRDHGRSVLERFNASPDQLLWYYGTIAAQAGERLPPDHNALQIEIEAVVAALERQVDTSCGNRDVFTGARQLPVKHADVTGTVLGADGRRVYSFDQWRRYAPPAKGDAHWKDTRSAKELARAWYAGLEPQMPAELGALLGANDVLRSFTPATLRPEHESALDKFGKGRQHDLVIYGTAGGRRVVLCIEAKADETFGLTIGEELDRVPRRNAKGTFRLPQRIEALCRRVFGRTIDDELRALRYQLLHGIAGAMIEAAQADVGAFIVHEFVPPTGPTLQSKRNHADLEGFVRTLTGVTEVRPGMLYAVTPAFLIGKIQTKLASPGIPLGA